MEKCVSCGRKRGMRDCPALGKMICPVCCGTKRKKEISCPEGCEILEGSRRYQLARESGQPAHAEDFFDVKIERIGSKHEKEDILHHIRTGRCPYTKGECSPGACPKGGMDDCPVHRGDIIG
jgi:hypothetical protein